MKDLTGNKDKKMKKVTIIICYYNEEKYLEKSIRSILNQSYENIELILINDGSTDRSEEIAEQVRDSRIIRISNKENHGPAFGRNQGLDIATGDYIGYFDADDIADQYKVEKQVLFLEKNEDVLLLSGKYDYIDKNDKIIGERVGYLPLEDEDIRAGMLFGNCFAGSAVIFRRKVIDEYGIRFITKMRTSQDYQLWLNCIQYGKIHILDEVLFHYRVNHNSQSNQSRKKDEKQYNEILMEIFAYAWKTRGFQIEHEDIAFIFTFLYSRKRLWRPKELHQAYRLFQKIKEQAEQLQLPEKDKILCNYKNALKECFIITKGIKTVHRIIRKTE